MRKVFNFVGEQCRPINVRAAFIVLVLLLSGASGLEVCAQEVASSGDWQAPDAEVARVVDSVAVVLADSVPSVKKEPKGLAKWWQSFAHGNIDNTRNKPFDVSFVVAPTYADDGGFGIGGGGSGLFRIDRNDTILPPSNVSLTANVTLRAFYSFYFKSNIYLPNHRDHFEVYADFQSRNRRFWGVNFDSCYAREGDDVKYRYTNVTVKVDWLHTLPAHFYFGAQALFTTRNVMNINGSKVSEAPELFERYLSGQEKQGGYASLGVLLKYDTRDFIPNPSRGVHVMLKEACYRKVFGAGTGWAWNTIFNFNTYVPMWRGSLLAVDVYGNFFNRDVPWFIRQEIAADYARMRGYYIGRYFDNNQMSATVELRQHIWKRIGVTAWASAGNFASTFGDYFTAHQWEAKRVLPSFGVGFRLEFKKNVNARIDYGFGRDGAAIYSAFVFDMGEAF